VATAIADNSYGVSRAVVNMDAIARIPRIHVGTTPRCDRTKQPTASQHKTAMTTCSPLAYKCPFWVVLMWN